MEVLRLAGSPCRPRSARYAETGYPNYAEEPDLCGPATPSRPRSARDAEKKAYRDDAEPDVCAVSAAPCSPWSAPCTDKGYPDYAGPPDAFAPSAPGRPRSARYAVKGYPDYAEPDVGAISAAPCRAPCAEKGQPDDAESGTRRGHEGGVPVKKPVLYYERRRRRAAASATETAVTTVSPFLQGGEAVAQGGRKRRTTVDVPVATDKMEVVPVDGGADEHGGGEGGGKSARLRVKETLRAFSSYYLHFVQVALFPLFSSRRATKRTGCKERTEGVQGSQASGVDVGDQFYSRAEMVVLGFVYSKSLLVPDYIKMPTDSIGCNCKGDCSTSKHCLCADLNGSDLPYVSRQRKVSAKHGTHKNVGRLVEPKAVVFECGANCSCHCKCVNRTSQQGLQYRLEVFKTELKGWGVRTWDTILPGGLVCEYTGVLRRNAEAEGLQDNKYIFDIDCLQTIKGLDGRKELSYDYGYCLDSIIGADGNVVKLACHCGASDCRKWLY
ncbi:hypothetical protein ACQ4PT_061211 [Festuca glaucescens]